MREREGSETYVGQLKRAYLRRWEAAGLPLVLCFDLEADREVVPPRHASDVSVPLPRGVGYEAWAAEPRTSLPCVVGGPIVEEFRERYGVELHEPYNIGEFGTLTPEPMRVRVTGQWIRWPDVPPDVLLVERAEIDRGTGELAPVRVEVPEVLRRAIEAPQPVVRPEWWPT